MKYKIKFNICHPLYPYISEDWEEKEISFNNFLDLIINPKILTTSISLSRICWDEITFINPEDKEHLHKLQLINSII